MKAKQKQRKITSTTVLPSGRKTTLSWDPNIDPETEDRLNFLRLSFSDRWSYMMALIGSNKPKTSPTNKKKIIEWR